MNEQENKPDVFQRILGEVLGQALKEVIHQTPEYIPVSVPKESVAEYKRARESVPPTEENNA